MNTIKNKLQKVSLLGFVLLTFLIPLFAYTEPNPLPPTPTETKITFAIGNPFKGGTSFTAILNAVLENIVMPIGAVVIVLAIIYSGFKFLTAEGKPAEIDKAKEGLLYVLIGAMILLGAVGISKAIEGTLKSVVTF